MPATKSKGIGTILLVLLLLLGVAGASAYFIHKILSGEDVLPGITARLGDSGTTGSTAPGGPAAPGGPGVAGDPAATGGPGVAGGPAAVGGPAAAPGQGPGPVASTEPVPPGQLVVPPASIPPPPPPLPGDPPVDLNTGLVAIPGGEGVQTPGHVPPTVYVAPPHLPRDGQDALPEAPSGETAPPVLLVPGFIAPPPQSVREDAVVRPAFVNDIAAFLAQNYWPKNTHPSATRNGITTASLQWANLRYGAELRGVDSRTDPGAVRRAILGYVLNPAAVGRIYGLYADGFVAALKQEADRRSVGGANARRSLTVSEKKEMFGIYADYASSVSFALENYAADSAMPGRVRAFAEAEQAVQDANRVYMESMLAHEEAEESGDRARVTAARLRMDKEAATYQKRIRERETKKDALVGAMAKGRNRHAEDTFVYAAFWAYRRGDDSAQSLRACAKALSDMSAKLTAASRQIQ